MYVIKQDPENEGKIQVLKTVKESTDPAHVVAVVTFLNLIQIDVTDQDEWTPPTQEQIDNLKRVFGINIQEVKED